MQQGLFLCPSALVCVGFACYARALRGVWHDQERAYDTGGAGLFSDALIPSASPLSQELFIAQ